MGRSNYGTSGSSYDEENKATNRVDHRPLYPWVDKASPELMALVAAGSEPLDPCELMSTRTATTNSYPQSPVLPPLRFSHALLSLPSTASDDENGQDDHENRLDRNNGHLARTSHRSTATTAAELAGNVLEWYNFALMGYFSDVLAAVCFPPQQHGHAALMESFAVFGTAFLMRPIGGIVIGYLGDTYGRTFALKISLASMALPTTLLAVVPTYQMAGHVSYGCLLVVRLLQGASAGGQLMSSLVYALEGHAPDTWGLVGSRTMATACFGAFTCAATNYILRRVLSPVQLQTWGWRLACLVGGVGIALCAAVLHCCAGRDDEALENYANFKSKANRRNDNRNMPTKNPVCLAFARHNRRSLLAACMIPMLWSGGFWFTFAWMATFMLELIPTPVEAAMATTASALFLTVCLLFPLAGMASDWFGRRRVMTMGAVALGGLSPVLVIITAKSGGSWLIAFSCQSIMSISLSLWGAPMMAWLVESFSPQARLTSVEIGYNIGQALVGTSTPALATWLVDQFGCNVPGFWLTGLAAIALVGLWWVAPTTESSEQEPGCQLENGYHQEEVSSLLNATYVRVSMKP